MMSTILNVFTDGSVNTKSKTGYGAYLVVADTGLPLEVLKALVKVKRFENTSSTKLELQTVLWALNDIRFQGERITVYTDSQNVVGLAGRRKRLERTGYQTKNNTILANYELYQEFYRITDRMHCDFVKVRGHQKAKDKGDIDRIFTLVDKASRMELRKGGDR